MRCFNLWGIFVLVLSAGILIGAQGLPGMGEATTWASEEDDRKYPETYNVPDAPAEYQSRTNPNTSKKDLKKGKRYYKGKCADCHGEKGEGDEDDADSVAFANKKWMKTRSDGQLFYTIMFGAGEDSDMEAFGPESDAGMSEKKIWQLVAYLRTLVDDD